MVKDSSELLSKIENLEKQVEILEQKIREYIGKMEYLRVDNKRLQNDIKLLEEENKKLQNSYKEFLQMQSKTELAKQKLKKLIEKIDSII